MFGLLASSFARSSLSLRGFALPKLPAFNLMQMASFSKYISNARAKRLPLTTKRAGKGFYKGNRTRKEGRITSKGRFIRVLEKCTELMVPDLANFTLKPYVAVGAKRNLREAVVKL